MYTPYDSLRLRRRVFFFSPLAAAVLAALAVFFEGAAALAIVLESVRARV